MRIAKYTPELQKEFSLKTEPAPWMHIAIDQRVSGGDTKIVLAIYVWDTRQVIESNQVHVEMPDGLPAKDDKQPLIPNKGVTTLFNEEFAVFDYKAYLSNFVGQKLFGSDVIETHIQTYDDTIRAILVLDTAKAYGSSYTRKLECIMSGSKLITTKATDKLLTPKDTELFLKLAKTIHKDVKFDKLIIVQEFD